MSEVRSLNARGFKSLFYLIGTRSKYIPPKTINANRMKAVNSVSIKNLFIRFMPGSPIFEAGIIAFDLLSLRFLS